MERPEGSSAVTFLAENHGISCIDTLLEEPVTMIVDSSTAICVVKESIVSNRAQIKMYVKQLTQLVNKFSCLWIIVIQDIEGGTGMADLYTAISRFPIDVIVRHILSPTEISSDDYGTMMGKDIAEMIQLICDDTANAICLSNNLLREHFVSRDFLIGLISGDSAFIEHCDFLQLFPSINFYSAAQILSVTTLKIISQYLPDKISALGELLSLSPPINDVFLNPFFILFTKHCGLERTINQNAIREIDENSIVDMNNNDYYRESNYDMNISLPVPSINPLSRINSQAPQLHHNHQESMVHGRQYGQYPTQVEEPGPQSWNGPETYDYDSEQEFGPRSTKYQNSNAVDYSYEENLVGSELGQGANQFDRHESYADRNGYRDNSEFYDDDSDGNYGTNGRSQENSFRRDNDNYGKGRYGGTSSNNESNYNNGSHTRGDYTDEGDSSIHQQTQQNQGKRRRTNDTQPYHQAGEGQQRQQQYVQRYEQGGGQHGQHFEDGRGQHRQNAPIPRSDSRPYQQQQEDNGQQQQNKSRRTDRRHQHQPQQQQVQQLHQQPTQQQYNAAGRIQDPRVFNMTDRY